MLPRLRSVSQLLASSVLSAWLVLLLAVPKSLNVSAQDSSTNATDSVSIEDWVIKNPEKLAMIGMGIMILLLFITTLVVICMFVRKGK